MDDVRRKDLTVGEQFLLVDFHKLCDQRIALGATINTEINIFLLVVSAFAVATGFVTDMKFTNDVGLLLMIGMGSAALGLIGFTTFYRGVNARVQIFTYVRDMNRIRRYFVNGDEVLKLYAPPYLHDDKPSFLQTSQDSSRLAPFLGGTLAIIVLTSALAAISAISIAASLLGVLKVEGKSPLLMLLVIGVIVLVGSALKMMIKQHSMLIEAQREAMATVTHFPSP
jgi:hypothetical protein